MIDWRKLEDAFGDAICSAPLVVEVMLNPDGGLFIERIGEGIARLGELGATQRTWRDC